MQLATATFRPPVDRVAGIVAEATARGVCRVSLFETPGAFARAAPDRGESTGSDHPVLGLLLDELERYFRGELRRFEVPVDVDHLGTEFQRRVWAGLRAIPYGETRSYGELAAALGSIGASRAVGQANGRNPIGIVIPCHRVVSADGGLGGFSAGLDIKRALLELEGHAEPRWRRAV